MQNIRIVGNFEFILRKKFKSYLLKEHGKRLCTIVSRSQAAVPLPPPPHLWGDDWVDMHRANLRIGSHKEVA